MTIQPRSTDEIYTSIRGRLVTTISKISNFVSGSFNDAFISAYSEQIREAEIKALAAEFAGTVDYAGKELTQADLDREGISGIDPEEINPYMEDSQLDNLAANFGVERFQGSTATGTIEVTVSSTDSTVPNGFEVATQPDSAGNINRYEVTIGDSEDVTDSVSPDSGTTVTVDIEAAEVGTEYNTGSGTITYVPNPKPGIQSVTNVEAVQNGEEPQPNESLREDVKTALFDSSGGGTESGIIGYVENNSSSDVTVGGVDEYFDSSPTFVDVVVDGGGDDEIKRLIDESRPVGIRHNLVRPSVVQMGSLAYVVGSDLQSTSIRDSITGFLETLAAGETFYWSSLLQRVMGTDKNIQSIPALNMSINTISQDRVEYDDTQSVYQLNYGPIGVVYNEQHLVDTPSKSYRLMFDDVDESSVTVTAIVGDSKTELESTEFGLVNSSGNGGLDTVEIDSSVTPDEGTAISVDYTHSSGSFDNVNDLDGTTYELGVDYTTHDSSGDGNIDSIEWLDGGSTPSNGGRFEMQYTPYRSVSGDITADNRERFGSDQGNVEIRTVLES